MQGRVGQPGDDSDTGQWAIPGGMVEPGESAMIRELLEETGADLADVEPVILTRTHVDDPRDSDHAWIATTAGLYRLLRPVDVAAAPAAPEPTREPWMPGVEEPADSR